MQRTLPLLKWIGDDVTRRVRDAHSGSSFYQSARTAGLFDGAPDADIQEYLFHASVGAGSQESFHDHSKSN